MKEKDCIFLVADKQMEEAFKGFLGRNEFHLKLNVHPFTFDIIVETGSDPGVYKRAHQLLRLYQRTHQHAIVVLDEEWGSSPGATQIEATINKNLTNNGWREEDVVVIVIKPELEVWLWQDSPHIANAFRFDHSPYPTLRNCLEAEGLWLSNHLKPARPKEAFEWVQRKSGLPRSGAIYNKITASVSVRHCTDPAFRLLHQTLQRWFPPHGVR